MSEVTLTIKEVKTGFGGNGYIIEKQGFLRFTFEFEQLKQSHTSLTNAAETLLAVLKRGDDPTAAMYQLEEVLSDAP